GLMITSSSVISSGVRGSCDWYFGSLIKESRKLILECGGLTPLSCNPMESAVKPAHSKLPRAVLYLLLRQLDQLLRHPFADAFFDRALDTFGSIVPIVARAFRAAVALVI